MPDTASDTIPNEQPATPAERVISELHLSSHDVLANCERTVCPAGCGKHRRYYCCDCLVPCISHDQSSTTDTTPAIPNVSLPLHVHLFQAGAERPQQSTAQHVALLAPDYATLWRPFPECADLFREKVLDKAPPDSIALLFPDADAKTPEQAADHLKNLQHLIVLDATWTKSTILLRAPILGDLPKVALPSGPRSLFWRYPPLRGERSAHFNPTVVSSLLSTVEAVHRFCVAFARAKGMPNEGLDDLLWLFIFLRSRVTDVYRQAPGKRRRIMRKSKGLLDHL